MLGTLYYTNHKTKQIYKSVLLGSLQVGNEAMPPRLRAPLTAHIRKRLKRGVAKASSSQSTETETEIEVHPLLQNSREHVWVSISSQDDAEGVGNERRKQDQERDESVEDDALCDVLDELSAEFKEQKRMYSAKAASSAIRLLRSGRQDDINPGLWPHIRRKEESRKARDAVGAGNAQQQ